MRTRYSFIGAILLLLTQAPVCKAQKVNSYQLDSIHFDPVPFLTSSSPQNSHPKRTMSAGAPDMPSIGSTVALSPVNGNYAVGMIPYQEGTTPSGGKTITVPIMSADIPGAPEISLVYNSQAMNGVPGWGWSISGISSLVSGGKTIFYDNEPSAPESSLSSNNAIRYLDGVRLLENTNSSMSGMSWETAQGFSFVSMNYTNGPHFQVMRPDGSTSSYGAQSGSAPTTYRIQSHLDPLGYRTVYEYETDNGNAYVQRITYGSDGSSSCPGEIRFSYITRTDTVRTWMAGHSTVTGRLLKRIESYYKGDLLRRYELTHDTSESFSKLTRIDCYNADDEQIPPLNFTYGETSNIDENTLLPTNNTLLSYFPQSDTTTLRHIRGKLFADDYSDALISLPARSAYTVVGTVRRLFRVIGNIYGSGYAPDQEILVYNKIEDWTLPQTLIAGSGFQDIYFADLDGDGIDEVVKVNYSETTASHTKLLWTVYRSGTWGLHQTWSGVMSIPGATTVGSYYSPYPVRILPGDFNGDGRTTFLVITGNDFSGGASTFCKVTLDGQSEIQQNTLAAPFNASYSSLLSLTCMDLDGDGRTELLRPEGNQSYIYRVTDSGLSSIRTDSQLTSYVLQDGISGDLNGDGLQDFVYKKAFHDPYPVGEYMVWRPDHCPICGAANPIDHTMSFICRNCSASLYNYYISHPGEAKCYICGMQLSNSLYCSQHGGLISSTSNPLIWKRLINTGHGFHDEVCRTWPTGFMTGQERLLLQDANKDGKDDLILINDNYLQVIINLNGELAMSYPSATIQIDSHADILPLHVLRPKNQSIIGIIKDSNLVKLEWNRDERFHNVLTHVSDSYGNTHYYEYGDLSECENYSNGTISVSYPNYKQRFPLVILKSERHAQNGGYVTGKVFNYEDAILNRNGFGFLCFGEKSTYDPLSSHNWIEVRDPELQGMTTGMTTPTTETQIHWSYLPRGDKSRNYRIDSSTETNLLTGVSKTISFSYDNFNQPLTQHVSYATNEETETTSITYTNIVSSSRYRIGLPYVKVLTRTRGNSTWQDKTTITYSTQKELPVHQWVYTGILGEHKTEETVWTYDSHGNVLTQQSKPFNATAALTKSYTYSTDGLDLLSETSPDGLVTEYTQYDRYKRPQCITDPLGNAQSDEYDTWGNLIRRVSTTGDTDSTLISWGGAGLYVIEKRVSGRPITRTHYDAAGREIRAEIRRFDGQWQKTDKEYDYRGRLLRTSLPYRGNNATLWDSCLYDNYDRPIQVTSASGNIQTWVYDGLTTTETKNGITSSKTLDETGKIVTVEDAGGEIQYTYRADGNPSTVTAPGNITTSFSYDPYGRRLTISDPSAGVQRDTLSYNADGTSVLRQISPKGEIVSYIDRFGRTTRIERQNAFNTDYTYDTMGRLISVSSSNGTGKTCSYDTYGRVSQESETVSNSISLTKYYTYGPGDQLSSVRYQSSLALDITENYAYANGWNTAVTLSDGSGVFQLIAENDFGSPTSIQTGGVLREYGFSTTGLPTYRKMNGGLLQDFSYTFDPQTGNLLSRGDSLHHHTEQFGYDELDRLVSVLIDNSTEYNMMTYDSKGNITKMGGSGSMQYQQSSHPYRITKYQPDMYGPARSRDQMVNYTSFSRPATITESSREVTFGYNDAHERVWMQEERSDSLYRTKYYLGGCYEAETELGNTVERLYLCGSYYDSPMVYVTSGTGSGALQNIGRDYLGSVTHVASVAGVLIAEYSYDAWGNRRDPETLAYFQAGSLTVPELVLGRGYTGHEHLEWFGLINMNARLYDPAVGRFLSPDPFVQAPDFTQSFNRYSYALNNPLKYRDEEGETFRLIFHVSTTGFQIGVAIEYGAFSFGGGFATDWSNREMKVGGFIELNVRLGVINIGVRETLLYNTSNHETTLNSSVALSGLFMRHASISDIIGIKSQSASAGISLSHSFNFTKKEGELTASASLTKWAVVPSISASIKHSSEGLSNLSLGGGLSWNTQFLKGLNSKFGLSLNKRLGKEGLTVDFYGYFGDHPSVEKSGMLSNQGISVLQLSHKLIPKPTGESDHKRESQKNAFVI